MDPVVLFNAASAALNLAVDLYTLIQDVRASNEALNSLCNELDAFKSVLMSVETSLKNPQLVLALQSGIADEEARTNLNGLHNMLEETKKMLQEFSGAVSGAKRSSGRSFFSRAVVHVRLELNTDIIEAARGRIRIYTSAIHLGYTVLQFLITAKTSNSVDDLTAELQRFTLEQRKETYKLRSYLESLSQQSSNSSHGSSAMTSEQMLCLDGLMKSAESVSSGATTYIGSVYGGSVRDDMSVVDLSEGKRLNIEDWTRQTIIEEEDPSQIEDFEAWRNTQLKLQAEEALQREDFYSAQINYEKFLAKAGLSGTWPADELYEARLGLAQALNAQRQYASSLTLLETLLAQHDLEIVQRLQVTHFLAETCIKSGKMDAARYYGENAATGREKLLGRRSGPFQESVKLFIRILEASGDFAEAGVWLKCIPVQSSQPLSSHSSVALSSSETLTHHHSSQGSASSESYAASAHTLKEDRYSPGYGSMGKQYAAARSNSGPLSASRDRFLNEKHVLPGHSGEVTSVVFSRDGSCLYSAPLDMTIRIWQMKSSASPVVISPSVDRIRCLAIHPNESLVAIGCNDSKAHLIDIATGGIKHTLKGHSDTINSVSFTPDGSTLLTSSFDHTLRTWDTKKGKSLLKLKGHKDLVREACVSPIGSVFVSGSWDETVHIWDARSGKVVKKVDAHAGKKIGMIAFSPCGTLFASGGWDKQVKTWAPGSGKCMNTFEVEEFVYSLSFSPNSKVLAVGAATKLCLFEASSGKLLQTINGRYQTIMALSFSPDGNMLATVDGDDTSVIRVLS